MDAPSPPTEVVIDGFVFRRRRRKTRASAPPASLRPPNRGPVLTQKLRAGATAAPGLTSTAPSAVASAVGAPTALPKSTRTPARTPARTPVRTPARAPARAGRVPPRRGRVVKRRRKAPKPYACVSSLLPEESRFRVLSESFLSQARDAAVAQDAACAGAWNAALDAALAAAAVPESFPAARRVATRALAHPGDADVRARIVALERRVAARRGEVAALERLRERVAEVREEVVAGGEVENFGEILGEWCREADGDVEKAREMKRKVEECVLRGDAVQCAVKRLEVKFDAAAERVGRVADRINARVSDDGILDLRLPARA